MAVRKDHNSWMVDFRHAGFRYRKKSPDNTKVGAEAYEVVLRQKLARGEPITSKKEDQEQKQREQKLGEFAWKWLETYVKSNNKNSVIHSKQYILRSHLVPFFGDTPLDKISTQQVELYKANKVNDGLSAKTINNHLSILSTCLKIAQEWFELDKIPRIKRLKEPQPKTVFLSQEESEKLIANSTGVWQDVIYTILKSGLRRGELKALRWSDIDWDNRVLTVRHSWCECTKGITTTKGNRERHIPLADALYKRLLKRKQTTGYVFWSDKTRGFDTHRINIEISKACQKAGIKKVTCHTLRHTFASHLAMAGAPIIAIQDLLGHADIKTTMRYAHLSPSTLRDTVRLLEPNKRINQNFGHYMVNR